MNQRPAQHGFTLLLCALALVRLFVSFSARGGFCPPGVVATNQAPARSAGAGPPNHRSGVSSLDATSVARLGEGSQCHHHLSAPVPPDSVGEPAARLPVVRPEAMAAALESRRSPAIPTAAYCVG